MSQCCADYEEPAALCDLPLMASQDEIPGSRGLLANDTTRLLGLEGVQVMAVELGEDGTPWLALATYPGSPRSQKIPGRLA